MSMLFERLRWKNVDIGYLRGKEKRSYRRRYLVEIGTAFDDFAFGEENGWTAEDSTSLMQPGNVLTAVVAKLKNSPHVILEPGLFDDVMIGKPIFDKVTFKQECEDIIRAQ